MSTIHIESKKEDIAPLVLMPGDPMRAQYIAETYLKDYKIVNKVRGMTAYTGYYDNKLVTVFPSSMGNPSMGIYSYELFKNYDVSYIIRIGSMGSYTENLQLNDVFLVNNSYSNSNYGIILGKHFNTIASSNFLNDVIKEVAKDIDINIKGRHDPIIVPRVVVVVESMVAVTLVDMLFLAMTSRIDKIIDFWK